MPKIKIWTAKEIKLYDTPPNFNSIQRKKFLTLPVKLKRRMDSFHTPQNKIGFCLMYGYFKARRRFFPINNFEPTDLKFLCKRLGIEYSVDYFENYSPNTYRRHRKIILDYFGYTPFKVSTHHPLITELIEKPLWSFDRAALILGNTLGWLEFRHIELPSYYMLQTILTVAIRKRNRILQQKLDKLLLENHKTALDPLLLKVSTEVNQSTYVFMSLKKLIRKDNAKSVRLNIEKHELMLGIYEQINLLLPKLNLNEAAIRYFGELVIKYKSNQIVRRSKSDKYLLLLGFTAFQIRNYEDQLVDILLSACRSAINAAYKKHKEHLFLTRQERGKRMKKAVNMAQSKHDLLMDIRLIIWQSDEILPPMDKVHHIQELLPILEEEEDEDQQALNLLHRQHTKEELNALHNFQAEQSRSVQHQVSPIIKALHFNPKTSTANLIEAIQYFKEKDGKITKTAPTDFLTDEQKIALIDDEGKFRISLYKMFLFEEVFIGIKSGRLNLQYSYRYKAYDEYLIPIDTWKKEKADLLKEAKLSKVKHWKTVLNKLKTRLDKQYNDTNQRIIKGENAYFSLRADGKPHVKTPKVEDSQREKALGVFPNEKVIPLSEVLATVNKVTNYLKELKHYQSYYRKQRPDNNVFFANIMAYGCNLGVEKMAKVARSVTTTELDNTANWYFDLDNIRKATDTINNFMDKMELPNLFKKKKGKLHTSSDGQKIGVASDTTIDAHYSFKYFGSGKGVTSYSFIDERFIPFYSTIINTTEREAIYVVDGLLHNERIRSTMHSTDTHGYSEAVFGLMDLLDFGFAPRIAKLHKQQLYSFEKRATYLEKDYQVLPSGYINVDLIAENWDAILRLVASIQLKHCTASQIFKRLNSYSRQHPVYQALKEYGKISKSIYLLRYIDSLELRQAIQKQLNVIELANRFSSAVSVANGGEMIFSTHREQLISDACKNLIKSAITCWNYLFMTRHIQQIKDVKEKMELIEHIKAGTAIAWRHIYFNGLFDFSDEYLVDSFNLLNSQNYDLNLE